MMDKKIKVSFIYRDCFALTQKNFYTYFYHFFFKALERNPEIDVNYVLVDEKYDVEKLEGKTDIILLYEAFNTGQLCVPDELIGIDKTNIPVISKVADPWAALTHDVEKYHEKLKIDGYFGPWQTDFSKNITLPSLNSKLYFSELNLHFMKISLPSITESQKKS